MTGCVVEKKLVERGEHGCVTGGVVEQGRSRCFGGSICDPREPPWLCMFFNLNPFDNCTCSSLFVHRRNFYLDSKLGNNSRATVNLSSSLLTFDDEPRTD